VQEDEPQETLPCPGEVEPVTVSVSPSASVSLVSTFTPTAVLGVVEAESLTATGA
jgi:hypothetical protein